MNRGVSTQISRRRDAILRVSTPILRVSTPILRVSTPILRVSTAILRVSGHRVSGQNIFQIKKPLGSVPYSFEKRQRKFSTTQISFYPKTATLAPSISSQPHEIFLACLINALFFCCFFTTCSKTLWPLTQ